MIDPACVTPYTALELDRLRAGEPASYSLNTARWLATLDQVRIVVRDFAREIADDVRIDAERIRANLEGPANREAALFQTGRIDAADKIEREILRQLSPDRRATPRAGDPIAEAVADLPPGGQP